LDGASNKFVFDDPVNGGTTTLTLGQLLTPINSAPVTLSGTNGNILFGAAGSDTLVGGNGNDTIYGFNGGNTLVSGTGVTTLIGNGGNDTFVVNNSADVVRAGGVNNTVLASVNYSLAANAQGVQNLTLTGAADLTGIGDSQNNVITANSGNDTLNGGAGNDTLIGGTGVDTFVMSYGMGKDTVIGGSANNVITLDGGVDFANITAIQNGNDLLISIRGTDQGMTVKDYFANPQSWVVQDANKVQKNVAEILAIPQNSYSSLRDAFYSSMKMLITNGTTGAQFQGSSWVQSAVGTLYSRDACVTTNTSTYTASNWYSGFPDYSFTTVETTTSNLGSSGNPVFTDASVSLTNSVVNTDAASYVDTSSGQVGSVSSQNVDVMINWASSSAGSTRSYSTTSYGILNGIRPDTGMQGGVGTYKTVSQIVVQYMSQFGTVTGITAYGSGVAGAVAGILVTNSSTYNFVEILGGASDNNISSSNPYAVIDGGAGNDTLGGSGMLYGGDGNDILYGGSVLVGGVGNDTMYGGVNATRFVIDPQQTGIDMIGNDNGISDFDYKSWYYNSIGIADWQRREQWGGMYAIDGEFGNLPFNQGGGYVFYFTYDQMPAIQAADSLLANYINTNPQLISYIQPLPPFQRPDANDYDAMQALYAAGLTPMDTVEFGSGIALSDISLSWNIATDGSSVALNMSWNMGASQVNLMLPNATDLLGSGVEWVKFTDSGMTYSMKDLIALAPPMDMTLVATAPSSELHGARGNDTITGLSGNNLLYGGAGNDILNGGVDADVLDGGIGNDTLNGGTGNDTLTGGAGNDTYQFNLGDGADTLIDNVGENNVIAFGAGINASDLKFQQQGTDMLVSYSSTGSILIKGFDLSGATLKTPIGTWQFADGSSILIAGGLGNYAIYQFNAAGVEVAYQWANADGSRGACVFNADGSSSSSWTGADGSYGTYISNADGSGWGMSKYADGSYDNSTRDALGNSSTLRYDANGVLTGSTIATNDGLGNFSSADFDKNGVKLSDYWYRADGAYGSDTFNADGSSSGTTHNADRSYNTYINDGLGKITTSYYRLLTPLPVAGPFPHPSTWTYELLRTSTTLNDGHGNITTTNCDANGNKLSAYLTAADGSTSSITYALDGSYTSYTIAANGTTTSAAYDIAGKKLNAYWLKVDGSTGSETYAADGSHTSYSLDAAGTATDGHYDTSGRITNDYWVKADGTTGWDTYTYNADGTSLQQWGKSDGSWGSATYAADGSHTTYSMDAAGTTISAAYDIAGKKLNAYWHKVDGSTGSETYAADGSHTSYSLDAAGTATDGHYDTAGRIISDYFVKADGTTGWDTYAYNTDGSALQQWGKSDGSSGSVSLDSTGAKIGDSIVHVDGSQVVDAGNNQLQLGSTASDTLAAATGKSILIGGAGNDILSTGAGNNLIAFNKGDGQDTVDVTAGTNNTVSIGGHFAFADLALQKTGNDLVLDIGAADSITFKNWYAGAQNIVNLQIIEAAMTDFNPGSTDALRNSNVENFDFQALVAAFDQAQIANPNGNPWSVTNDLLTAHLSSSDTAALGGDLAYIYGSQGSLTGMNVTAAQSTLSNGQFASNAQTLNPWPTLNTGAVQIR
jgi:Ca2+-binding RTX toxin-like protein